MTAAPTVGDPEAMRALAQLLTARAEVIATSVTAVSKVDTITFEGPAAKRLRTAVADSRRQVISCAGELRSIAAALVADAAKVELQNTQLQIAAAREAAEAERDARETDGDGEQPAVAPGSDPAPPSPAAGDPTPATPAGSGAQ